MSMSIDIVLLVVKLKHVNNDFHGLKMIVVKVSHTLGSVEPIPMRVWCSQNRGTMVNP